VHGQNAVVKRITHQNRRRRDRIPRSRNEWLIENVCGSRDDDDRADVGRVFVVIDDRREQQMRAAVKAGVRMDNRVVASVVIVMDVQAGGRD